MPEAHFLSTVYPMKTYNKHLNPDYGTKIRASEWALILAMIVMMLLFCITTLFNTKGEPREAIVAVSMLQSGDWILPSSFGGAEIPYKPPFFAWCIALSSLLFGGHVTEFTSRLPSLLAAILMTAATLRFFTRYGGRGLLAGCMTAWVTITSFEVFRAATACRVDMVLTACMVGAFYNLYSWSSRRPGVWQLPWPAILLMSGAFLTKGPVGVFLPCFVIGIFRLTRGDRFVPLLCRLVLIGLLSLLIPAVWYILAYMQGGDRFLDLALEENVGRMTGTMSYESHENPAIYNFVTLASGMLPYTLLALLALSSVWWRKLFRRLRCIVRDARHMSDISAFALITALIIFIFFCIPKSKRSVYLLPMYPFVAWGVTCMMQWLSESRKGRSVARWFSWFLGLLAIVVPLAWSAIKFGVADSIGMLAEFNNFQPFWMVVISALFGIASVFTGIKVIGTIRRPLFVTDYIGLKMFIPASIALFAVYTMLDNAILPPILSAKTDKVIAEEVNRVQPEGEVWSYVSGPMLRYYTANFYLNDRVRQIPAETPSDLPPAGSLMIINEPDLMTLKETTGIKYTEIWHGNQRSCDTRRIPMLIRLE